MSALPLLPELVVVPAGPFTMGEAEDAHSVELPEFHIGRYPVTSTQYEEFTHASRYRPPSHWDAGQPPTWLNDHPVVNVNWEDAVTYCMWLSEIGGPSFRLSTEAEWEKAARGADGRPYPWGDTFDNTKCNTWEAATGRTMPVDSFPAGTSPYGAEDMAGNVWEWCAPVEMTADETPYGWQALRGGSWYDTGWGVRCSRRLAADPDHSSTNTGFRVVSMP